MGINSGKYKIENGSIVNMFTGQPIPEGEPVFIIRGQDANAVDTLREYAGYCENPELAGTVKMIQHQFAVWQEKNPDKVKEPD